MVFQVFCEFQKITQIHAHLINNCQQINQNINTYQQINQMDDYRSRLLLFQEGYNSNQPPSKSTVNTPAIDIGYQFSNPSLITDHPQTITRKNLQQYEQQWEFNILNQIVRDMETIQQNESRNLKHSRYCRVDEGKEGGKPKNSDSRNLKRKKKQLSKYKAYAVKMKIPSNQQIYKVRGSQAYALGGKEYKNKSLNHFNNDNDSNYEKLEEKFRINARELAYVNIFQSSGANIFKKRPNKTGVKHPSIRKRSIKTSDKRKQEGLIKESSNKFLKTSTSPKLPKQFVISLDQSTIQYDQQNTSNSKPLVKQIRKNQSIKRVSGFLNKSTMKSPQKEKSKDAKPTYSKTKDSTKIDNDQASKFLQKMQKAIHFKKKQTKDESPSPSKEVKKQLLSQLTDKQFTHQKYDLELGQASKTIVRAIYTSKDVIKNRSNIIKESTSKQVDLIKKQSTNHRVFVFNSEDQYIRRLLIKSGWVHNHDNLSAFYNLKWVFKPDSINYHNLKEGQLVNHIRNSHQLTAKNYLNKNLKTYLSSWTSLPNFYPKCYDLAKASQKQDFQAEFKKQTMMILLQNLYEYFSIIRSEKIQIFTKFYQSLLDQNGNYKTEKIGESSLRKKAFRKIDMEDYRQYSNDFLVHMNLVIIALKYWRSKRKEEELDVDSGVHFLSFQQKEFEENFMFLQIYSKMAMSFSSNRTQSYFQIGYFATPSDVAIERVAKEYVYFQNQLGKQWGVFGKGNIWIVKPCSASRGNGIYLANNCSQILTDNRGIQSKIVQRYIERPLIIKKGLVNNKKFDLRQWVLLLSVEPLQIYMFSHCYVRICSDEFDITNIHNLKAHLTNYSFNKRHYRQPAQSVIDQDSFQQLLLSQRNISFTDSVRPKIKDIIINSIKSTQHAISDCGQHCFSLLGYDILLDGNCNPWLLEVNMSPACEQRTQWLKCYLQIMGRQLLRIVLADKMIENKGQVREEAGKKNWSPVNWENEALQMKKVKTEMSQVIGEQAQYQKDSYVNSVFELNKHKQQIRQDNVIDEVDLMNGRETIEEKINYEDFVYQHCTEQENWEQIVYLEEELNLQKKGNYSKKISSEEEGRKRQKFSHLQLYLNEQDEGREASSPVKSQKYCSIGECNSKSASPKKSQQVDSNLLQQMEGRLRWQKICYEQYAGIKKDSDFQMQVVGSKRVAQKINQIERYIEHVEMQNQSVVNHCKKIQGAIKGFLLRKKNEEKMVNKGLKINLSRLIQSQQKERGRQSKSALYTHEDKNTCNYEKEHSREASDYIKIQFQKPASVRNNSNLSSGKLKYSNQSSFRQKIRSIAFQASVRENNKVLEQQILEKIVTEQQPQEQNIAIVMKTLKEQE